MRIEFQEFVVLVGFAIIKMGSRPGYRPLSAL